MSLKPNTKRSSRKRTYKPKTIRRVSGRRRPRFETTARAASFKVHKRAPRGSRARPSLNRFLDQWQGSRPKPRQRRSKARLGQQEKPALRLNLGAAILAPAKRSVLVNGSLILNLLFLGLLGWALVWFFASDQFYVDQVVVSGNQRVPTEAILEVSALRGYSIFWVHPRRTVAKIEELLPPIKHAYVRYALPNIVKLIIEEQGDQVMWQVGERRYWVDEDGFLQPAQGESEPSLLIRDIRPGLPDKVDTEALVAARQLIYLLPELRVIEYAPITGLRLTHKRGWIVYLGTGDDMDIKLSILRAMEAQFTDEETNQPELIDLRFPDSPYYRLSNGDVGGN